MPFLNMEVLLFLQALVYATATGTKGAPGNQWNQNPATPQQRWPQTKGPLGGWDDEVSNPQGQLPDQGSVWKLEDSIPGIPGQSYPNLRQVPDTSFDCRQQIGPGYYADMESRCQVFHICQMDGRQNSFLCPVGTIFNQQTFTCDWWFNVNCIEATEFYTRNGNLYRGPDIGIDGSKVNGYESGRGSQMKGINQQPAIGVPSTKGGNWPSQTLDPTQGNWRTNQGVNQKGDSRPMNRRPVPPGQNWQNTVPGNTNGRRGTQKGTRQGSQTRRKQHKDNQNVWSFQGPVNSNQGWNQNNGVNQGISNPQAINQQRNMKGEPMNQRQPARRIQNMGNAKGGPRMRMNPQNMSNAKGGSRMRMNPQNMGNAKGDPRMRMNPQSMVNSNKGFNTNTWSIRARNFQTSSDDRTGSSSSHIWSNNHNNAETNALVPHQPWQNGNAGSEESDFNDEYIESKDQNNNWNSGSQNFNQWDENNTKGSSQTQWVGSYENDYDYS